MLRPEPAASLADGIKVRNLIAHAYGDVDAEKLRSAAVALPDLLEAFCSDVLRFALTRDGDPQGGEAGRE